MPIKLNTIKEYKDITINGKLPIALDNLDQVKLCIHNAKKNKDLDQLELPTYFMTDAKEKLRLAKEKINKVVKEKQEEAQAIELAIKDLEEDIKGAALDLVVITKEPKKDRSGIIKTNSYGEVDFKITHNLNTSSYSYTPIKTKIIIDEAEIIKLAKSNKELRKLVVETVTYSVDAVKLSDYIMKNGIDSLPKNVVETPAKISIKKKDILEKIESGKNEE